MADQEGGSTKGMEARGDDGDGESKVDEAERMGGVTKDDAAEAGGPQGKQSEAEEMSEATEWVVIAQIEGAHGVFEVNHVAWASRRDKKNAAGDGEDEDLIVTTGDDGRVKVWRFDV